jgi:amino acid adenylation domain-containing protein
MEVTVLVQDFLQQNAERLPNKVALICGDKRLTYAEIEARANRLANSMIDHGVKRGDRVVIYMSNSVEVVVSIFATLKAGGVFVVVNPTTKSEKLTYILNNCSATALVAELRNFSLVSEVLENAGTLKFTILSDSNTSRVRIDSASIYGQVQMLDLNDILWTYSDERPTRVNIDLDLACLIYTSGSTGEPKGVMSDHSNVDFATSSIIEYLRNIEDDIVIDALPLSFDYGLYQLLMVFKFGGTLVLERSFAYPAAILKRMEQERVTGFPGVPTTFSLLLQMDLSPYDLSSLRYITNTAAALPPSHILQLREKFPWATLYSMYGLTETKRTLFLPPDKLDERPDSVGIPIPGTEAWIEDENGNRLGSGETGELVVRGRHVMRGYWQNPEATAKRYRPGQLPGERVCYTGDLFRTDEEGYFYFVSRKDDVIKSRGEKVSPKEVENILYAIDGVVEAAVVGIPDPVLGQAIKALLVVDRADLNESKVLAHCRANLEDYMVPKYVEFSDQLPKTTSGKIKKRDLVEEPIQLT